VIGIISIIDNHHNSFLASESMQTRWEECNTVWIETINFALSFGLWALKMPGISID
jgi:hypothetical protein